MIDGPSELFVLAGVVSNFRLLVLLPVYCDGQCVTAVGPFSFLDF